jgi:hypothetical protein
LLELPEHGGSTFSETLVNFCQNTRHHIPEDSMFQQTAMSSFIVNEKFWDHASLKMN